MFCTYYAEDYAVIRIVVIVIVVTIVNATVRVKTVFVRMILLVVSPHATTRPMVKMMCGVSIAKATMHADVIPLGKR